MATDERLSVTLNLANEVREILLAHGEPCVEVVPVADIDLSKVRTRHIYVTPGPVGVDPLTRGNDEKTVDIVVAVADKPQDASLDAQFEMLHKISSALSRKRLHCGTIIRTTIENDLDAWPQMRIFCGSVTAHVFVQEDAP